MKKKAISLLLVAAMTATMTAGCGDKQEAADNTTAGNDAAPSTEAAASDDAAAAEEEEEAWSGTLTVWSPQEDQDTGWLQKECDAFNAAHPNWDVTFEYGVCAEGDAKATVTTDVEGSADVYMLANDNIPDLVAANALAELGGSYLDYVTSTNSDSITASVTYNDAVVAFPFTSNTCRKANVGIRVYSLMRISRALTQCWRKEKLPSHYLIPGTFRHSMLEMAVHYSEMVQTQQQVSTSMEKRQQLLQIT